MDNTPSQHMAMAVMAFEDVFMKTDSGVRRVAYPVHLKLQLMCAVSVFGDAEVNRMMALEAMSLNCSASEALFNILHDIHDDTRFRARYYTPLLTDERHRLAINDNFTRLQHRREDEWRTANADWRHTLPPALK